MSTSQETIEQVLLSLLAEYEKMTAEKIKAADEEIKLETEFAKKKTEIMLGDPDYAAQKNSELRSAYLDSLLFESAEKLWLAKQNSSRIGAQLDVLSKKISVYKRLLESKMNK